MSPSLEEKYEAFSIEQLIFIMESDEDDYTSNAKEAAKKLIENRKVLPDTLHFFANQYWQYKIHKEFKQLIRENNLPVSQFLSDVELRSLFQKEFEKWQDKQELFTLDTEKYWFV